MPFSEPSRGEALELRFTRIRGTLNLDEKVPLPVRDLPRDYRPEPEETPGVMFYYEIHDPQAQPSLLFRGTESDPTGARIETLAPEHEGVRSEEEDHPTMEFYDTEQESSHFSLIVPRFAQPTQILIFSREMARVFTLPPEKPIEQFAL